MPASGSMENVMLEWFRRRYLDVVGSIYIYNEHRGYTAIDRVIEAVRERSPVRIR